MQTTTKTKTRANWWKNNSPWWRLDDDNQGEWRSHTELDWVVDWASTNIASTKHPQGNRWPMQASTQWQSLHTFIWRPCCSIVKPNTNNKEEARITNTKAPRSKTLNSVILKSWSPLQVSVDLLSWGDELTFTFWKWPCVKRIKLECTRLILGILHWVFT
jgi:hypothetical protein